MQIPPAVLERFREVDAVAKPEQALEAALEQLRVELENKPPGAIAPDRGAVKRALNAVLGEPSKNSELSLTEEAEDIASPRGNWQ